MCVISTSSAPPMTQSTNSEQTALQPAPKATAQALRFLDSIQDEDLKYLMFDDSLVTTSDTGKELGEFTVSMETVNYRGKDCVLVHANSHGAIDGVPCGTSITAYIGKNMRTVEQQHHEYVKLENCPLDRKTFIVYQDDTYIINRIITQGEDVQRTSKTVPRPEMEGFISEGANLLLHRLLITKGIPENMQVISFDSDTNLCPATFQKLEDRTQTVDTTELKVYGIERTINSVIDLPTTWQSYFMEDGHLTHRVQVGSPVTMKLIRAPSLIIRDEEPPKPTFEKQPLNWEEDSQLYSRFMDRKEELKGDHGTYMRQHPELKALLADFLQFLLLRKPNDVIAFSAEYFASFSPAMPSPSPYLASNNPTPFIYSRGNTRIEELRAPTR
ncbi:hypothetical protein ACJMK2_023193 [Sinanodonta woodiana]|uniref:Ciliogenesis-associated TTC17-interacting protein n=1 Tax=Sinanodonta woodiana TaxID=1069815 RepID=A0ABD3T503_SINWO